MGKMYEAMEMEAEFSRLVSEHKSLIYSVCYMFSKDADEVSDMFQEILINLWSGLERFRGDSSAKTWIWRISLNTCISYERKASRMRRNRLPLSMDIDLFDDTDEDTMQIRALHRRIGRLRPFDRAIVLLWLDNLSYQEIAAIVGISVKNVSVRLFRIKEQLKTMSE